MKIGILGGGQLGRMMALAGYPLGLQCRLFDPNAEACGGQVTELFVGNFRDQRDLRAFAEGLDVVTIEWENVPLEAAEFLAQSLPFWPPPSALEVSQDRLSEKTLFASLGIGTAPFEAVDTAEELHTAVERLGLPSILKTRRDGYDGLGQWHLQTPADVEAAARALRAPSILEGLVAFDRELSIIAVRATDGEVVFYPLAENQHRGGILRLSRAPAAVSPEIALEAERIARLVLEQLNYVGVLTIELFQVGDRLLANEMAPRVHNSGHWTIDGAVTSQFENHLRAVAGLSLRSSAAIGHSAMVNLIGSAPPVQELAALPGVHVHLYGKSPRPGRKLGHLNLVDLDATALESRIEAVTAALNNSALADGPA